MYGGALRCGKEFIFDEEDVLNIAVEWSINPKMLLGREEARTVLADRIYE